MIRLLKWLLCVGSYWLLTNAGGVQKITAKGMSQAGMAGEYIAPAIWALAITLAFLGTSKKWG